jgi:hypothetical protein
MNPSVRRIIQGVLGVAAIACFAIAMQYMHRSGCSADLKTGSWGDINLALAFESLAIVWGTASAVLLALLAASFPGRSAHARAGAAIGAGVLGYIVLISASIHVQMEAIQRCT